MADFRILDPDLYNNSTGSASLTETKMKSTAEEAYQAQLVKVKLVYKIIRHRANF